MQTKKYIYILVAMLILSNPLFADMKKKMLNLYQNKNFNEVCKLGFRNFSKYRKDEDFVTLYAFSCLKADYIDRLSIPIATLKFSKEARANAAYFSVILMQKKLLYSALLDGYKLSEMDLPTTDYVLSKVFDLYAKLKEDNTRDFYIFQDKDDTHRTYKLYLEPDPKLSKIIIEEYYDAILLQRHTYW